MQWFLDNPEVWIPTVIVLFNLLVEAIRRYSPVAADALGALGVHVRPLVLGIVQALKSRKTPPAAILPVLLLVFAPSLTGCGPAQHPCVGAYERARTEAEIAQVDATCGHMLLGGGGQGGGR